MSRTTTSASKFLVPVAALILGSVAHAQNTQPALAPGPLPDLPDEAAVAIVDGSKMTMGEFKKLSAALPPETTRDREAFIRLYAMSKKFAALAEAEKLDQQSPWKEMLEYQRLMILSQAEAQFALTRVNIDENEIADYYSINKEKFKVVKVKSILIAFTSPKMKLTEQQAAARANDIWNRIRTGADFLSFVHSGSDDETSTRQDGDFSSVSAGDATPAAISQAALRLKAGEVSEPVRQPNGYYILRAEAISYRPFPDVGSQIFGELQSRKFDEWMKKATREIKLEFPNPAFLGKPPAGRAVQP